MTPIQNALAARAELTREWALRTDGWSPWPWPGGQRERDDWRATVRRRMKAELIESESQPDLLSGNPVEVSRNS